MPSTKARESGLKGYHLKRHRFFLEGIDVKERRRQPSVKKEFQDNSLMKL